jgi:hypothetical protein
VVVHPLVDNGLSTIQYASYMILVVKHTWP